VEPVVYAVRTNLNRSGLWAMACRFL